MNDDIVSERQNKVLKRIVGQVSDFYIVNIKNLVPTMTIRTTR